MRQFYLASMTLLLSIGVLTGCGAEPEQSAAEAKVEQKAKEEKEAELERVKAEQAKIQTEKQVAVQEATKEFEEYLLGFEGTSWYDSIQGFSIVGDTMYFETSIYPDEEGKEFAAKIPPVTWGWTNANDSIYEINSVIIKSKDDHNFFSERNPLF